MRVRIFPVMGVWSLWMSCNWITHGRGPNRHHGMWISEINYFWSNHFWYPSVRNFYKICTWNLGGHGHMRRKPSLGSIRIAHSRNIKSAPHLNVRKSNRQKLLLKIRVQNCDHGGKCAIIQLRWANIDIGMHANIRTFFSLITHPLSYILITLDFSYDLWIFF